MSYKIIVTWKNGPKWDPVEYPMISDFVDTLVIDPEVNAANRLALSEFPIFRGNEPSDDPSVSWIWYAIIQPFVTDPEDIRDKILDFYQKNVVNGDFAKKHGYTVELSVEDAV